MNDIALNISVDPKVKNNFTRQVRVLGGSLTLTVAFTPDYPILRKVTFVYDKQDGVQAKWRNLDVVYENDTYIEGLEDGAFKRFLRSKILGGRILPA